MVTDGTCRWQIYSEARMAGDAWMCGSRSTTDRSCGERPPKPMATTGEPRSPMASHPSAHAVIAARGEDAKANASSPKVSAAGRVGRPRMGRRLNQRFEYARPIASRPVLLCCIVPADDTSYRCSSLYSPGRYRYDNRIGMAASLARTDPGRERRSRDRGGHESQR